MVQMLFQMLFQFFSKGFFSIWSDRSTRWHIKLSLPQVVKKDHFLKQISKQHTLKKYLIDTPDFTFTLPDSITQMWIQISQKHNKCLSFQVQWEGDHIKSFGAEGKQLSWCPDEHSQC